LCSGTCYIDTILVKGSPVTRLPVPGYIIAYSWIFVKRINKKRGFRPFLTVPDTIKEFKHIEHLMTTEKPKSRVIVQRLIFADGHAMLFFQILFKVSHKFLLAVIALFKSIDRVQNSVSDFTRRLASVEQLLCKGEVISPKILEASKGTYHLDFFPDL
jgi:hypothetical protein